MSQSKKKDEADVFRLVIGCLVFSSREFYFVHVFQIDKIIIIEKHRRDMSLLVLADENDHEVGMINVCSKNPWLPSMISLLCPPPQVPLTPSTGIGGFPTNNDNL